MNAKGDHSTSLLHLLVSTDVEYIAQRLLGSTIITEIDGMIASAVIVETEAYKAPDDKGSHAYGNKRTARTNTLFENPGTAYVYLCYGIHHLFNIVSGPEGVAHATLIRAVEPIEGIDTMMRRRGQSKEGKNISNGPGKLSQALGIDRTYNGCDLLSGDSLIQIKLPDTPIATKDIIKSPRVGIAYAEECALWPWRFRIKDNAWTSLPHKVEY